MSDQGNLSTILSVNKRLTTSTTNILGSKIMSDKEFDHVQNNFEYSSDSEVQETSEATKSKQQQCHESLLLSIKFRNH